MLGRNPYTPHHAAGSRTLPPESLPIPSRDAPAATSAASPLLDPPTLRDASSGWATSPQGRVFATTTAPASRSLRTTVASRSGLRSCASVSPAHGNPSTSIQSFTVTGRPCRGPTGPSVTNARSSAAASASARPSSKATTAFVRAWAECSSSSRSATTSVAVTPPRRNRSSGSTIT